MNIFKISIFVGIFILVILASGGCSHSRGKEITGEQLMSLEVGKTTLQELKRLWGEPWNETVQGGDGSITAMWMWSKTKIQPIPFFGSKGSSKSGTQILFFDKDGILNRIQ
jgi:hypothetical protein